MPGVDDPSTVGLPAPLVMPAGGTTPNPGGSSLSTGASRSMVMSPTRTTSLRARADAEGVAGTVGAAVGVVGAEPARTADVNNGPQPRARSRCANGQPVKLWCRVRSLEMFPVLSQPD